MQEAGPAAAVAPDRETILVVGGGIVGRASALQLCRSGCDVVLVDPDMPSRLVLSPEARKLASTASSGPASFGNAGHIATEQVRPLTNPAFLRSVPRRLFLAGGTLDVGWRHWPVWLPWTIRAASACFRAAPAQRALTSLLADALPAWERFAAALGDPGLLVRDGHLMLWHGLGDGTAGSAAWQRADTGTARTVPMDEAELDRVASQLSVRPQVGLRFEGTGQVRDVAETMAAVAAAFADAAGRQVRARVRRLVTQGGRTGAVLGGPDGIEGETLWADKVLVAAGVDSRRLLRGLGVRLPVIAERGYHLEWRHGGRYDLPPLVFEERSLIVTRFGKRLRASSFVEFNTEDAPPDSRKWTRLEAHVRTLGLPVASPFSRWIGARPTLPDYLPAIGRSDAAPGLFIACGHQHLGLTLAPRTAEIIAAVMTGRPSPVAMTPFDPDRFGWAGGARRAAASRSSRPRELESRPT